MANGYMPLRENDLLQWSMYLSQKLVESPEEYGVTAQDAAAYQTVWNAFAQAYQVANSSLTRSTPYITAKDDRKEELLRATRPLVARLQAWSGMSDEKRSKLGLRVRASSRARVKAPHERPSVSVVGVDGWVLKIRLMRDGTTSREKPAGVRAAWLYTFIGDREPQDLSAYTFQVETTRNNPRLVVYDNVRPGTRVWVTARWVSPTGKPGPACRPIMTHIGYAGVAKAAYAAQAA